MEPATPRTVALQNNRLEVKLQKLFELESCEARDFCVFVDGSENAHLAFLAVKALTMHGRGDTLTVVTVESDKEYLKSQFKNSSIKARYEGELVAFVSERRRAFVSIPRSGKSVAVDIAEFINNRDPSLPDPGFVAVGFSGRKSSGDRDPTVVGQTADLSLRRVFCPSILVKCPIEPHSESRHFVMLVRPCLKSKRAAKIYLTLLRPADRLTFIHCSEIVQSGDTEDIIEDMFGDLRVAGPRTNCVVISGVSAGVADAISSTLNDDREYADVEFVGVGTRPTSENYHFGSISDHLVRYYKGNVVIVKTPS